MGADETEATKCAAHGTPGYGMCSRNDGPTCDECATFESEGMHWDTCPNRDRTPLAEMVEQTSPLAEPESASRIRGLEFDLRRQEDVVQDLRGKNGDQAAIITGLNAEILGLNATLTSAQDRLRESASLVQEFAFGIGERDEKIAQLTDLPSPETREVTAKELCEGDRVQLVGIVTGFEDGEMHVIGCLGENFYLRMSETTATRTVSPLPDRPGAAVAAPGMREVPASEAIDGDQVTINGYFHGYNTNRSTMFVGTKNGATVVKVDVDRMASNQSLNCVTVTRAVPSLPDKPGQQGTARVRDIRRFVVRSAQEQEPVWFLPSATNPEDAWASSAELSDYQDGVL